MSSEVKKKVPINKVYEDWDCLIIQLHNEAEGKGKANIKMMRQDIEAMAKNHGVTRGDVIEMMVKALEEEAINKKDGAEL